MALSSDSNSLLNVEEIMKLRNGKVGIVYTEWNEKIVAAQIEGAKRIAEQTKNEICKYAKVPGCFEIPHAVKAMYEASIHDTEGPNAIIAFGAVIRGGTPHFDYVCQAVTQGLSALNIQISIPIIFGVLTLDNEEQAWERLGGSHGHKGEEAMIAALKMIHLRNTI